MRSFTVADTTLTAEYGIHVGRWSQFEATREFPFDAMWCVVPAASQSALDQHPEVELAIVVGGRATFAVGDRRIDAPAGTAVLFEPQERHVIHNADPDEPVRILSVYWLPEQGPPPGLRVAGESVAAQPAADPVPPVPATVVLSPPPTPNGPLHVGHLSGPYVAADIAVRAARRRGERVISVCGLDDHQNYVPMAARVAGTDVESLRDDNAARIRNVLGRLRVRHDIFTEPLTDSAYRTAVVRFLAELVESGAVPVVEWTAPVCEPCGGSLHHGYVAGGCPFCGKSASGGTCEGCGGFVTAATLRDPVCTRCGQPPSGIRTLTGPVLPLSEHRELLERVWRHANLPPRVRALIDRLLATQLPVIPLTYPTDWGIPVPGTDGHRLDVWAEMALGYLYEVGRTLDPSARTVGEHVAAWGGVGSLWAFLGIDNAFYYAVLFPALFGVAGLPADLLSGLVVNEFYTLDGEKFSTSRRHAIWADELLDEFPADVVRAFLSWDRPQAYASDFSLATFREVVARWPRPLSVAPAVAASLPRAEYALTLDHFAPDLAVRCLLDGVTGGGSVGGQASTGDTSGGPAAALLEAVVGTPDDNAGRAAR
jgi:methionyl-tRNA synthetase